MFLDGPLWSLRVFFSSPDIRGEGSGVSAKMHLLASVFGAELRENDHFFRTEQREGERIVEKSQFFLVPPGPPLFFKRKRLMLNFDRKREKVSVIDLKICFRKQAESLTRQCVRRRGRSVSLFSLYFSGNFSFVFFFFHPSTRRR